MSNNTIKFTREFNQAFAGAEGWGEYRAPEYETPFFAYGEHDGYDITIIVDANGAYVQFNNDEDEFFYNLLDEEIDTFMLAEILVAGIEIMTLEDFVNDLMQNFEKQTY